MTRPDDYPNFSRLDGIRGAYATAFFKNANAVDNALSNDDLDALNAVRNLIVHRSAVIDREYNDRSKHLDIPKGEEGDRLLDGDIVINLLRPALKCSIALLASVDNWLASN
jgi:hypothetical protein